jgi:hypothetical protein
VTKTKFAKKVFQFMEDNLWDRYTKTRIVEPSNEEVVNYDLASKTYVETKKEKGLGKKIKAGLGFGY